MIDALEEAELFTRFDDPKLALDDKNAALAASVVKALVESDSWGEVPVAPAFSALLSAIPEEHGWPIVRVVPVTPREVLIEFPATPSYNSQPSMHALASAFGLTKPRVSLRGAVMTGAGRLPVWALQGLPAHVECEAQELEERELRTVTRIVVRRPHVPEREHERPTKKLVEELEAIHKAADARDGIELPELKRLSYLFPVFYTTLRTGFRWIDLDRLWTGLGQAASAPQQHTLSARGPGGLPMRMTPSLSIELPLSRNRHLAIEAKLSTGRWVRELSVHCYVNP